MATSEISICNIALSLVGSDTIRSFTENNTRAGVCKNLYDPETLYLLSEHDWTFARRFSTINKLEDPKVPSGWDGFAKPSDCLTPRSIDQNPSTKTWEVFGDVIATPCTEKSTRDLRYTSNNVTVNLFSQSFVQLLSYSLASKLAMALAKDKTMSREYSQMAMGMKFDAWESDANVGNIYRDPNNDAVLDSFVYPQGEAHYTDDPRYNPRYDR